MKLQFKHNPAWRRNVAVGDRRRWLLWAIALKIEIRAIPIWTFEIFWKRLLVGLGVLTIGGYLGAATALYVWLDRQPQNQVTWTDVATAPVRWEHFRRKRGDTSIAQAMARLQAGDYVEAFHGLRVGLARAPGNFRGRILLARLYAGQDPALALRTLEAGLVHSAAEPEFLRALYGFYAQMQVQAHADATADRLLASDATPSLPPLARSVLQALQAGLVLESDPAKAVRLLEAVPPSGDAEEDARVGRLHAAALTRLGRHDEARALLVRTRAVSDGIDQCRAEAELAVATANATELESVLRRLRLARDIETPQAYLVGFNAWHQLRRLTLRDTVEQEFYRTFGAHDAAMQLFAANAVNLGLAEVVARAQTVAQENGLSTFAFRVHQTELALRRGEFDNAFRHLHDWEDAVETLAPPQRAYPELIERLTRTVVAGGENQVTGLLTHLGTMRGRATPSVYRLVLNVLERAGQPAVARQALETGLRLYPLTDLLAAEQQRLAGLTVLIAPNPTTASSAPAVAATAEEALAAIDAALAAQTYVAVREQLRAVRTARPAWLSESDAAVGRREIELALATQDLSSARLVVRGHLDRHRSLAESLAVARLAAVQLAAGRTPAARLLHDEVAAARGELPEVQEALAALGFKDDLATTAETAAATLAALDQSLAARRAEEALRLLDYVRQKNAPWLAETRNELAVREVRVRLALRQRTLALAALKDLTVRGGLARGAAFRLVREMIAAGETETASLLAREIVRLLPEDAAAAKLLQEAETPRPSETPPAGG